MFKHGADTPLCFHSCLMPWSKSNDGNWIFKSSSQRSKHKFMISQGTIFLSFLILKDSSSLRLYCIVIVKAQFKPSCYFYWLNSLI